jgi:hypothetical protein
MIIPQSSKVSNLVEIGTNKEIELAFPRSRVGAHSFQLSLVGLERGIMPVTLYIFVKANLGSSLKSTTTSTV